mmetsp:Transcript_14748/g.20666  ORF Transcript_14748/g.20666 Transcript_14748/m.20666 type:complete len:85 (-) Transcript_14748:2171-2425(-)
MCTVHDQAPLSLGFEARQRKEGRVSSSRDTAAYIYEKEAVTLTLQLHANSAYTEKSTSLRLVDTTLKEACSKGTPTERNLRSKI